MTDAELIEISEQFRDGLLGPDAPGDGMCAATSHALAGYLRSLCGVDCDVVQTDLENNPDSEWLEHVWVRLSDGRALDATFDQFCSEEKVKVYLGKPTEFHANPIII